MGERLQRVIDMLELVEVRRAQNHKLMASAIDTIRAIQAELEQTEKQEKKTT